ncbi:MAG: class I SAM-dependent methyltransferase [Vicinamibacterales bacterium]
MTDQLPPSPAPIPAPDRHQIERLNELYDLTAPGSREGWRGRLIDRIQRMLSPLRSRQRAFNAVLVDHINRNDLVGIEAHRASAHIIEWMQFALEELRRHQQALAAWERRSSAAVASLAATHEELRTAIGVLQQATQTLKREVLQIGEAGAPGLAVSTATAAAVSSATRLDGLDSHKYVGFEDRFRGSQEDISRRVANYLPIFRDAQDVLDVGCGRGEFLTLLRGSGIGARGIDINAAMVDVCRQQGLDVVEADVLTYLESQPDGSLGGLFAAQVVEHLEPRYLNALLDTAFDKLRPGAPIVLETINPACWFAFFESYLRDITHVRPLHPDTLKFLLIASGFQQVDIRYRSPFPEHDKLQPIAPHPSLGDAVETLNANVERLNGLLFTWLDYAAIGRRA